MYRRNRRKRRMNELRLNELYDFGRTSSALRGGGVQNGRAVSPGRSMSGNSHGMSGGGMYVNTSSLSQPGMRTVVPGSSGLPASPASQPIMQQQKYLDIPYYEPFYDEQGSLSQSKEYSVEAGQSQYSRPTMSQQQIPDKNRHQW